MGFLKKYWPGIAIFIVFTVMGLMLYQNYGVSNDESAQNEIGMVSYEYVYEGDTVLNSYIERDHGVGFELPLIILEKEMKITDTRDVFLLRHLVTHLFFLICMLSGYFLAYKLFKNQFIACATLIMLILYPRIYGHSYFNSKDVPSLSTLLLILALSYWAFERRKPLLYLLLGIACGYAMSIRLMNVVVILPLLLFILLDIGSNYRNKTLLKLYIIGLVLFCLGTALTLYACWPTLWTHPIDSLKESFLSLSKFRLQGSVRLAGLDYDISKLPWSYIPTWFFVTVPEVWLLFGCIGSIFILAGFFKNPFIYFENNNNRHLLLYLYCFIVPVICVVVLGSVLYDDWRHLYFIYPPFILLAAFGMNELLHTKFKLIYKGLWILQFVYLVYFTIRYHPFEYVYFNHAVSHKKGEIFQNYPLDYWGISNIDGLEWVLAHSDDNNIYINNQWANYLNMQLLTPDKRKRFILTSDDNKIEYYIERGWNAYKYPEETAVYQVVVSNSVVLRVTKLH